MRQQGRFNSIDPKAEADYSTSPFAAMGNNPASQVDPLGDITYSSLSFVNENFSQFNPQNDAMLLPGVTVTWQKPVDDGSLNIRQAALQDIGRNDANIAKQDGIARSLVGIMGFGVLAPAVVVGSAASAPVLATSILGNPVAWTEGVGGVLYSAAGHDGHTPGVGSIESTTTTATSTLERNVFKNSLNLTTSSTSTVPAQVYTIYEASGDPQLVVASRYDCN